MLIFPSRNEVFTAGCVFNCNPSLLVLGAVEGQNCVYVLQAGKIQVRKWPSVSKLHLRPCALITSCKWLSLWQSVHYQDATRTHNSTFVHSCPDDMFVFYSLVIPFWQLGLILECCQLKHVAGNNKFYVVVAGVQVSFTKIKFVD